MQRYSGRRGASLIELMVVLSIVFFLMLILGLGVTSTYQASKVDAARIDQQAIAFTMETAELHNGGKRWIPSIDIASVEVSLDAQPVIDRIWAHSEYQMVFTGRYTLRNPDPEPRIVSLSFPFSGGARLSAMCRSPSPAMGKRPSLRPMRATAPMRSSGRGRSPLERPSLCRSITRPPAETACRSRCPRGASRSTSMRD